MTPRFLLDTHILIRWMADPKRLSREQLRIMEDANRRGEVIAISAFTLVEIAVLVPDRDARMKMSIDELFAALETSPTIILLPLTIEIAREASRLSSLPDQFDRVIVATARVHGLRLLTSDQRIIESNTVSTVD